MCIRAVCLTFHRPIVFCSSVDVDLSTLIPQVLPRQVCALYTKTYKRSHFPGGVAALERNIYGGSLFETILYNYVSHSRQLMSRVTTPAPIRTVPYRTVPYRTVP